MRVVKITFEDKVPILPPGERVNQVWAQDINEIKEAINANADELTAINLAVSTSNLTCIEVTYDELMLLIGSELLSPGRLYLLSDYETTYTQPVTGTAMSSGVVEPLVLQAISGSKLANQGRSLTYAQDVIYYTVTGDAYDGYSDEGFTKGKIYRRIDTLRSNDIGTDWRHVKYRRGGVDKLLFEDYDYCFNNVIKTTHLFNSIVGNGFSNNRFEDGFTGNTIGNNCTNNNAGSEFSNNSIDESFSYNNIGGYFKGNVIDDGFVNNKIGDRFENNTSIGDDFKNNVIDNYFSANTIGDDFNNNTVKVNFKNNVIGTDFSGNTVNNDFTFNTVGNNADSNTIGSYVYSNTIGDNLLYFVICSLLLGKDVTAIAGLYSKDYMQTINRKPNDSYYYHYTDDFGDTIITDIP